MPVEWLKELMCHVSSIAGLIAVGVFVTPSVAADTAGGRTMGTTWTATWHGTASAGGSKSTAAVGDELRRLLDRVDRSMSTWRDDSEVSRFNVSESTDWFSVSAETAFVLVRALQISSSSDGAFDVTVSPLVDLWGFGSGGRQPVPTPGQLEAARELVGWNKLEVRAEPPAIRKTVAGVTINLSAIAKGYAVDLLGEHLESLAVSGYLVEIGGETRVKGQRPDGTAWRIGVEQPLVGQRQVRSVLLLSGPPRGIATSGDYRNRRAVGGQVVSHTLDPRTGRPVSHDLAAVTVVADDCMTADALATTLMVLGPDEGFAYAKRHRLAALLLLRDGPSIRAESTAQFREVDEHPVEGTWLGTWLPVLVLVTMAVAGLSVGVLLRGRGLVGSCGGLALLCNDRDDPHCSACGVRKSGEKHAEVVEPIDVAGGAADG